MSSWNLPQPAPLAADRPPALVAYVDGSGTIATEHAGCGLALFDESADLWIAEASWYLGRGTNNFAEVQAIRVALWATSVVEHRDRPLVVRSDSLYAINSVSRFQPIGRETKNGEVILATRAALVGRRVFFEHVRGHKGVVGNERADKLANRARRLGIAAEEARARGRK